MEMDQQEIQVEYDVEPIKTEVSTYVDRANSYEVVGAADAERAAGWINELRAMRQRIVEYWAPKKKAADESHRLLVAAENELLAPVREAESLLTFKVNSWRREQDRLKALEDARRAEADRKAAEEAALAEAEALEKAGEPELAQTALEQEIVTVAPPLPAKTKIAGFRSPRANWQAQVTNMGDFVKAVSANPAFLNYLQANQVALNAAARAQKSGLKIPGLRVWNAE